jgi:taurine dioxygenase
MAETLDQASAITLRPLSQHVGVEVLGLDASRPVSQETARQLRQAFRRHKLVLLRGQELSPEQQSAFARVFGRVDVRDKPLKKAGQDYGHVSNVLPDGLFGDSELNFHVDHLFYAEPSDALMLYGIEVTKEGGQTQFCDTQVIYERMDPDLRGLADRSKCRHERNYDSSLAAAYNVEVTQGVEAVHPLVWTDASTGHKALWVNRRLTVEVLGMEAQASQALIARIRDLIEQEGPHYAHQWRPGDLVLWNNRALHHSRTAFDPKERRTLRRTPLLGLHPD